MTDSNKSGSAALIQELVLRGYAEVVESGEFTPQEVAEYGDAMDEFLDEQDAAHFIRDQPENVQAFWDEFMEDHA